MGSLSIQLPTILPRDGTCLDFARIQAQNTGETRRSMGRGFSRKHFIAETQNDSPKKFGGHEAAKANAEIGGGGGRGARSGGRPDLALPKSGNLGCTVASAVWVFGWLADEGFLRLNPSNGDCTRASREPEVSRGVHGESGCSRKQCRESSSAPSGSFSGGLLTPTKDMKGRFIHQYLDR